MGTYDAEGIPGGARGGGDLSAGEWQAVLQSLVPAPGVAAPTAALALAVGTVGALGVSVLRAQGMRVAYTRKIFHLVVFTAAAVTHVRWGLGGTVVFGSVIAGMVLAAVLRGDGHPFFEALARDRDRPRRALFVVVPLVTTAVGGLVSALIAGPYALVGFLVAGWGDAVGEPVGARWGSRPYKVPSLAGVAATRTVEGSAAVLVVSTGAAGIALATLGHAGSVWWAGLLCGCVAALVEAISNHGLDNLTVQIVPSIVARMLFG